MGESAPCTPSPPSSRLLLRSSSKNFCGPTWKATINQLAAHGYRVIAVDQVGFCKSSKPENYQFSLQQFASSTSSLLNALDIYEVTVIGHSLGGMLAARYSMMYPNNVTEVGLWKSLLGKDTY